MTKVDTKVYYEAVQRILQTKYSVRLRTNTEPNELVFSGREEGEKDITYKLSFPAGQSGDSIKARLTLLPAGNRVADYQGLVALIVDLLGGSGQEDNPQIKNQTDFYLPANFCYSVA